MTKIRREIKSSVPHFSENVGDTSFRKGGIKKGKRPLIGFIGQGFIGKNYADDFENRGYTVVRYAMEEPYRRNKEKIQECDIVFIAVPTPSTPKGFDYSIVEQVLALVGKGKTAVIKSTILPGTTEKLQAFYSDIFVLHSPEFLTEKNAAYDAAHPDRNIVGVPKDTPSMRAIARKVLAVLPKAPYHAIIPSRAAELVKYGGNCWFYFKIIFMNLIYDVTTKLEADFNLVRDAMAADPRVGRTHLDPVHQGGRGAGGHCFIKDFAAFSLLYEQALQDPLGVKVLEALRDKNNELLRTSGKDLDLLEGVYGKKGKKI